MSSPYDSEVDQICRGEMVHNDPSLRHLFFNCGGKWLDINIFIVYKSMSSTGNPIRVFAF